MIEQRQFADYRTSADCGDFFAAPLYRCFTAQNYESFFARVTLFCHDFALFESYAIASLGDPFQIFRRARGKQW